MITVSYGACELDLSLDWQSLMQQANAQGITILNSSGDSGAAGCDSDSAAFAANGLAVAFPRRGAEVTAVGEYPVR